MGNSHKKEESKANLIFREVISNKEDYEFPVEDLDSSIEDQ